MKGETAVSDWQLQKLHQQSLYSKDTYIQQQHMLASLTQLYAHSLHSRTARASRLETNPAYSCFCCWHLLLAAPATDSPAALLLIATQILVPGAEHLASLGVYIAHLAHH